MKLIIEFDIEIAIGGQAILTIILDDGSDEKITFDTNRMSYFASVCAMLTHSKVYHKKVGQNDYLFSK